MRDRRTSRQWPAGSLLISGVVAAILLIGALPDQASAQDGAATFESICKACHTIGGGRLVGPDLAGVNERHGADWIVRFVQHSQAMIAAGDPEAVAVADANPGLVMPDWPLSDAEVRAVLGYIQQTAAGPAPAAAGTEAPVQGDPTLGLSLFQGTTRLANGGPACNSCHEVSNEDVIGGGVLAKDLTTVFTRLGGPGVRAIVGSSPFPVMQRAFLNRPLTNAEVAALVAFLERADAEHLLHQPRDYGMGLFTAGIVGAVLLLGLYSLAWRKRKRGPVNAGIYARQVRSS